MKKQALLAWIEAKWSKKAANAVEKVLIPSARLLPGKEAGKAGDGKSFLGGLPELPDGVEWPTWDARSTQESELSDMDRFTLEMKERKVEKEALDHCKGVRDRFVGEMKKEPVPLAFIGQINLKQVSQKIKIEGLPKDGSLAFFYDLELLPLGYSPEHRGGCRVIYCPQGEPTKPVERPRGLSEEFAYPRRSVEVGENWLPYRLFVNDDGEPDSDASDDLVYMLEDEIGDTADGKHQLGGQCDSYSPEDDLLYCELGLRGLPSEGVTEEKSKALFEETRGSWMLLAHFSSDSVWTWADPGDVYFWAKRKAVEQRTFDEIWAIFEPG